MRRPSLANSMAMASPSWTFSSAAEADPRDMERSVIFRLFLVVPDMGFIPLFLELEGSFFATQRFTESSMKMQIMVDAGS